MCGTDRARFPVSAPSATTSHHGDMTTRTSLAIGFSVAAIGLLPACGSDSSTGSDVAAVIDPGDDGAYDVAIDPAAFAAVIDNPYLPKIVGTRWVYEATTADGEVEQIEVEVLDESRTVMGVETIVVHDVVSVDGEVIEDTFDWFAQDADGNVWYFGEDTTAYEDGVASSDGAWEAGVDGALPGVVMWADPASVPGGYRQEFLAGEAEDMAAVIATSGSASTPAGDFDDVVVTRDWSPLEPEAIEEKTFARGVGFVSETKTVDGEPAETVVLVEFMPG
jgi:hypothetical protein